MPKRKISDCKQCVAQATVNETTKTRLSLKESSKEKPLETSPVLRKRQCYQSPLSSRRRRQNHTRGSIYMDSQDTQENVPTCIERRKLAATGVIFTGCEEMRPIYYNDDEVVDLSCVWGEYGRRHVDRLGDLAQKVAETNEPVHLHCNGI
jgi:hypothetical protein